MHDELAGRRRADRQGYLRARREKLEKLIDNADDICAMALSRDRWRFVRSAFFKGTVTLGAVSAAATYFQDWIVGLWHLWIGRNGGQ